MRGTSECVTCQSLSSFARILNLIGLAIKHRYGLEYDGGDYEARRILEKFVDSYEDLSATASLRPLIQSM